MIHEYDEITAFHYAAYRPQLHSKILKQCIASELSYASGLDIGSGTGQSTIALADFCSNVVGIEPSEKMRLKAIAHPKVSYPLFDKKHIDFEDDSFDIVTLAGSLWYAKSQQLLDEICRVSTNDALVVVYDFEVFLKDILISLGFKSSSENNHPYNHQEDFSGLEGDQIHRLKVTTEKTQFDINAAALGHLVLSVKNQYLFFVQNFEAKKVYSEIVQQLLKLSNDENFIVQANLFATVYKVHK